MPFHQFFPRPFLTGAIETIAPSASGVYGISNATEWIFIGESDDIRNSLLNHSQESNTALSRRNPTGFVFEVCDVAHRAARQDRLVGEYGPKCNRNSSRYS
jgi:hypothetical protein